MGLVIGKSDIRVAFERQWSKFVPAILQSWRDQSEERVTE